MNKLLLVALLSYSVTALADGQSECDAAAGTYLTGTVISAPKFARGVVTLKGVSLSHTHINLLADRDNQTYDVAMDNVYAVDYIKNANAIPASLRAIRVGDHLALCGQTYTRGVGIHWVHSNCNVAPDTNHPDGSVKEVSKTGVAGRNLEGSQAYCYLWH